LSKFNFVNNTNSSGHFYLWANNHKRVKESVIVFEFTDAFKWVYSYHSGATLSIEGCFVITSGAIDGGRKVTLRARTISTIPNRTPFYYAPIGKSAGISPSNSCSKLRLC